VRTPIRCPRSSCASANGGAKDDRVSGSLWDMVVLPYLYVRFRYSSLRSNTSSICPSARPLKLIRKVDNSCSYVRKKIATFCWGPCVLVTFESETLGIRDENTEELPCGICGILASK
jgi:hypothetical protein